MDTLKSWRLRRLAIKSFAAAVILSIVAVVLVSLIPTGIRSPVDAGFASLWRYVLIAIVSLSFLNVAIALMFMFYSLWLETRGE